MSRTYVFAKRGASTSQTSYEIRGSDLRLLKSPSVGSTGKRSTGPFSYAVSPRLALIFMPKNRDFPLFKSGLSLWVTGYKTLWSEAWCISRWYIVPQTIFCTNGCAGDKVEIPIATDRKSLPKRRKTRKEVENPVATVRKSLPKRRKSSEKGRESCSRHP